MRGLIILVLIFWNIEANSHCSRSFDGVDNYIIVPDVDSDYSLPKFTVECWTYIVAVPDETNGDLVTKGMPEWQFRIYSTIPTASIRLQLIGTSWAGGITGYGYIAVNKWHHFAGTFDGVKARIYVDGVLRGGPSNMAVAPSETNLYIGSRGDLGSYYNGKIDEVRIWNYVRTQQQIESNMHGIIADEEPGLVGYWDMDEPTGHIFDSSIYDNHSSTISGTLSVDNAPIRRVIGE